MLEGLAVWALIIYLLRLVGMPWNVYTQCFAYIGGGAWLLFVWVALISYAPMDLGGGAYVQSPHIQLRPDIRGVDGKISTLYIEPTQEIKKDQLVYDIDPTKYALILQQRKSELEFAESNVRVVKEEVNHLEAEKNTLVQQRNILRNSLSIAVIDLQTNERQFKRLQNQNTQSLYSVTESELDQQAGITEIARNTVQKVQSEITQLEANIMAAEINIKKGHESAVAKKNEASIALNKYHLAELDLDSTRVYAPADGFVTNFIAREGQQIGTIPRLHMYTNEKYILVRVNHQAVRNIKKGQYAEFATAVYPGHIFQATVEGIVEATGESQGSLISNEQNIRQSTIVNKFNKHHYVRLKIIETEQYDIPVGSSGLVWISAEKPIGFLGFVDVIRGMILRMKAQIFFFYTM
ncbi:HlyD family secretion protein [Vibrio sp.]|nr:HlyD family secretion protein [Vibrio sp.]